MFSLLVHVIFFFFKQKTAYEMRISDWSSDVCSSDLAPSWLGGSRRRRARLRKELQVAHPGVAQGFHHRNHLGRLGGPIGPEGDRQIGLSGELRGEFRLEGQRLQQPSSEEHTSELQSLMRLSSALFCFTNTTTI